MTNGPLWDMSPPNQHKTYKMAGGITIAIFYSDCLQVIVKLSNHSSKQPLQEQNPLNKNCWINMFCLKIPASW